MYYIRILFFLLFSFSLAFGSPKTKPEFKNNPPTSDVPSVGDGGYKFSCAIAQINPENIGYVFYEHPKEASFNFQESGQNLINSKKFIPNGHKVKVQCTDGNYVFNVNATSNPQANASFELSCIDGSLKRKNGTEFCDKKCDILPLKESNYRFLNDILLPGQTAKIKCPDGKITQTGSDIFEVSCEKNGLISKKTPECIEKATACKYKNDYLKEGFQLQCASSNNSGLNIVNCEKGVWIRNPKTCDDKCFNNCKFSVAELDFNYQNLNDTISVILEEKISIQKIQDACKNSDGTIKEECKGKPMFCDYNKKKYSQQDEITLLCNNKEKTFRCYGENFVFTVSDKTIDVDYIDITDPICKGAKVIKETPSENKQTRSSTVEMSVKERQLELYRTEQDKK